MPRFSVVIPLYNKENFIENTMLSLLSQTFSDFEVLIVNDCSTDASEEIVKRFNDRRIQIIQHPINKGLSASRNTGIKNAKSNYVAFLDADDLWKPSFLEKIDILINKYPQASLFATKYEVLQKENRIVTHDFKLKDFNTHGIIPNFFESNLNQSIYYPSCLCANKSIFEDVGYYNEEVNYSEDVDFNLRAHSKYKLAYWDEAAVTYLLDSENQITQNGLKGKTIPDYDFYEAKFKGRQDIKKYLDFQRYIKAKLFKLDGDKKRYLQMTQGLDHSNLNKIQKTLLKSPKILLQAIGRTKLILRTLGIEFSSY
ncbi:MAG: glycosyltransferase involved in cell wall biosynthesis [Ulvibacter sp.]|jgi:glycosyltransferase involved in cell wall biosynthesis|tara:strand:+ start:2811 stop:3746 length:936 start_codon:yes stop_codon:yes gene_type:complete